MTIKQESEPHNTTKVEPVEESKCVLATSDGKGLKCMNDNKDVILLKESLLDGQTTAPKDPEDVEVDIVKFITSGETRLTKAEDPDATEYSSSFGDTESDTERCSGLSEAEVESQYFGDSGLTSTYDGFGSLFQKRKKKLTNHWRSFIHPLMWRCKWAELRIKEIESQALKYDRELSIYEHTKLSRINQSTIEGFGSKSLPFSTQYYRKKALKRRKRKRVEEMTDITSYMSHHSLFSYHGISFSFVIVHRGVSALLSFLPILHSYSFSVSFLSKTIMMCDFAENKRTNADGNSTTDDFVNMDQQADCNDKHGSLEDPLFFEFRDGDNSLEQVLWKIEIVHTRVHKLKNQLDIVMSKNASKFSSSENLSLLAPCEAQTSCAPSPTFSAGNADTTSVGAIYNPTQNITDYDIGDLVMPESAISSYIETIHVPDIIESTVGLLSAADVTFHQPQIGDSCEDILDNILIQNDGAEGERQTFLGTSNQAIEMHHESEKGEEGESANPSAIPASEPDSVAKPVVSQEQSTLKSCLASDINFPRNKRKRGERKAGPGSWSKRGSSEPDSQ